MNESKQRFDRNKRAIYRDRTKKVSIIRNDIRSVCKDIDILEKNIIDFRIKKRDLYNEIDKLNKNYKTIFQNLVFDNTEKYYNNNVKDTCTICLNNVNHVNITCSNCNNIFHWECMSMWNAECPICRF